MPQLDFSIASSQIFWLIISFFLLYTILTHFFLPNFIKVLKTRKLVLLENTNKLVKLKNQFESKQKKFVNISKNNLINIKDLLEKEISLFFKSIFLADLNLLDKKVATALYFNLIFYDINILKSIYIKPMF